MKNLKLIGIHGKAYSGKSSLAEEMGKLGFYPMAFATPVKILVRAFLGMLGLDGSEIAFYENNKDTIIPCIHLSIRQLWQTLATDWGRNLVDEAVWAKMAEAELNRFAERPGMRNLYDAVLFEDVRFENEAEFIRNRGGILIHLVPERVLDVSYAHESERGIAVKEGDIVYNNDHGLAPLLAAIAAYCREEGAKPRAPAPAPG